ncbi:MAG: FixH family protein [Deltaproteobacteria bacterium]|nr:FixH family protein [Deltaproteobacteria bacterium]
MELRRAIRTWRWPLMLGGLLAMSITAHAVLVFVATRPDAPRPLPGFYERSLSWDQDAAVREASRGLGWTVTYEVPGGPAFGHAAPRPVDVTVRDRDGAAVTGLEARLEAIRPADPALDAAGRLVELPHAAGRYRALVPLAAPGLWELRLAASRGALRFVHAGRVDVPAGEEGP